MITWGETFDGMCYGFARSHNLPVIGHVYVTSGGSVELPFGWDLTVGISSFHPGTFAGDDCESVEAGQAACEKALAVWVAQLDARKAAERLASERWYVEHRGVK